jgi:hypothetical protein
MRVQRTEEQRFQLPAHRFQLRAVRAIALSSAAPDAARDAALAALGAAAETRSGFSNPQHAQLGLVGPGYESMIKRLRAMLAGRGER